jgi:hypothetical protein
MKILLDECVTKHSKPHLNEHEVLTVREMQWGGIKNGKLMALCVEHHFDILLTIDKSLQYQQNLARYPLTIVVLNSFTVRLKNLQRLYHHLRRRLNNLKSIGHIC